MNTVNQFIKTTLLTTLALFYFNLSSPAQDKEYPKDGSIEEQINHIIEKSSPWEKYKMISNTWIATLKKNVLDSVNLYRKELDARKISISEKESEISTLQKTLNETQEKYNQIETEKNTITLLGINISKNVFISTSAIILLILIAIALTLFGLYNRSFTIIRKTQEDLAATTKELEDYKQEARKKYEQLVVQHHKEIQKLKGL